jgi:hypothetical protein
MLFYLSILVTAINNTPTKKLKNTNFDGTDHFKNIDFIIADRLFTQRPACGSSASLPKFSDTQDNTGQIVIR